MARESFQVRNWSLAVIIVMGLVIISYFGLSRQTSRYAEPFKKLTLGVGSGILPTAVWVSENNGYFKKEGIDWLVTKICG